MSERKPTPAEREAWYAIDLGFQPRAGNNYTLYSHDAAAIARADYVLDLADRIRRERQEQEGQK